MAKEATTVVKASHPSSTFRLTVSSIVKFVCCDQNDDRIRGVKELEARDGIEPPIKVLQTLALPLGDRASDVNVLY